MVSLVLTNLTWTPIHLHDILGLALKADDSPLVYGETVVSYSKFIRDMIISLHNLEK